MWIGCAMAKQPTHNDNNAFSDKAWLTFRTYVEKRFGARGVAAFIGGSVARGVAETGSDVDGVIILPDADSTTISLRTKTVIDGLPLDLAVYNMAGLKARLDSEYTKANPWVMEIVASGQQLTSSRSDTARSARKIARDYIAMGPPEFSPRLQRQRQVELTELADNLLSSKDAAEQRFVAALMVPKLAVFHLRANNQWIGNHRKLLGRLRDFDTDYAVRLDHAVHDRLGRRGNPQPLLRLTAETLAPAGGLSRTLGTRLDPTDSPKKPRQSGRPGPG